MSPLSKPGTSASRKYAVSVSVMSTRKVMALVVVAGHGRLLAPTAMSSGTFRLTST